MDLKFGHLVASSNDNFLQFCIIFIAKTDEIKQKNLQKSFVTLLERPSLHAKERIELKSYNWPRVLECPQLVVSVWKEGPFGSHFVMSSIRRDPPVRP